MINETVIRFINEFENQFGSLLSTDHQKHRADNFYTEFFKIKDHIVKPKRKYSDWDLYCWIRPGFTQENIRDIDEFVRSRFAGLSGSGLFSLPGRGGLSVESSLHYMSFMPDESYAPFFDFKIKGSFTSELWAPAYRGTDEEHARWAIFTGWRKIKNGDIDKARDHYRGHIGPYIADDEKVEGTFVDENKIAEYYRKKFQDGHNADAVEFLLS